jgi:hypothetical protein
MRALTTSELLDICDAGRQMSPSRRSLLLLAAVLPEEKEALAEMPLGAISARLLQFRAALFGPTLTCLTNCPTCGHAIETAVEVDDLLSVDRVDQTPVDGAIPTLHSLEQGDYTIEFRLPTARDVMALNGTEAQAVGELSQRLINLASHGKERVAVAELPGSIIAAVEQQITDLDPLAQIELVLSCPECSSSFVTKLQIIDFLWQEMGHLAKRLLFEVAQLASAFGWSEQEILNLSPGRRRSYLELLGV